MRVEAALASSGAGAGPERAPALASHPSGSGERRTYLLNQHFRYEYPVPIESLRHRLMVVPPERHGDQRLVSYHLEVRGAGAAVLASRCAFGNHQVHVRAPRVAEAIEFETWVAVERSVVPRPFRLLASVLSDRRFVEPSPLTRPDAALREVAHDLRSAEGGPLELAERIAHWVHEAMRYSFGTTKVSTTAAEALAGGSGVCQDYAHIMLALARLCGLAARYVSGHLLGEGGSHAWVEVFVPEGGFRGEALVVPLDPTHGRRAGWRYVTVATGRDYADVAPTSGTYHASCAGRLFCRKRLHATGPEALAS